MSWKHIAALAVGATLAVVGAVVPGAQALIPLGSTIVGGVIGHVVPNRAKKDGSDG